MRGLPVKTSRLLNIIVIPCMLAGWLVASLNLTWVHDWSSFVTHVHGTIWRHIFPPMPVVENATWYVSSFFLSVPIGTMFFVAGNFIIAGAYFVGKIRAH